GDEFAVFVHNPNQQKMLNLNSELKAFVANYNLHNPQLPISLSIGWAANFAGSDNVDELFKQADNNMYREKMHQSQSSRSAIVQAMMRALEARDYITEGHADRLQELVEKMAHKLDLPDQGVADLRLLAKFHDVGKVGIPDSILFKASSLTMEEMAVMRRHCEIGYRIAKSAPDLVPIADWVLKHQEWWNGQGYPLGIAGEEIPVECRILALADAYDAMTNDRPYRKAMTQAAAAAEIARCAGSQFDPELAAMFVAILGAEGADESQ
ncbi:MAG: HD domain-containing phosphohydrolase, partial [Negativicutes bacterium]|nr:HD domain-containing phosphohydrolase [Negativicutes bacterium]